MLRSARSPGTTIRASRPIRACPHEIYAFLASLANHWSLADEGVRLVRLNDDGRGGLITIHGPVGLRRTARMELRRMRAPEYLSGLARIGRRTRAHVSWRIAGQATIASVVLTATVVAAGPLDRALLAIGARLWLRRRFERVLKRLDAELGAPGDAIPPPISITHLGGTR